MPNMPHEPVNIPIRPPANAAWHRQPLPRRSSLLTIFVPNGSLKSRDENRINLPAFLASGGACPEGYAPDRRVYFPRLSDMPNIQFVVGRPQHAAFLAERGGIDAAIVNQDVLWEALAGGVCGVEQVLELPFASVDLVVAAREEAPFAGVGDLIRTALPPLECISELPFLARTFFAGNNQYRARFGATPPAIVRHNRTIKEGSRHVRIVASDGTSEPLVRSGHFPCCFVVRSSGNTIRDCRLRVLEVVASACPVLFCRSGLRHEPAAYSLLQQYIRRLRLAMRRWASRPKQRQFEFFLRAAS